MGEEIRLPDAWEAYIASHPKKPEPEPEKPAKKPERKEKFDQVKYVNMYVKGHYDRVELTLPKESKLKERIKDIADRQGLSVNQFIIRAIEKELEWYE